MSTENRVLPIINLNRCTGCGCCVDLCPTDAVELIDRKAVVTQPDACTFCEICESYCPEEAIGRPFLIRFEQRDQAD